MTKFTVDGSVRLERERAGMELSFAQMVIGVVEEGWITKAEGKAWLTGTVPALVSSVIGQIPEEMRFRAEARAVRPSVILRNDPLVGALALAAEKTPEEIDNFFRTYAEA